MRLDSATSVCGHVRLADADAAGAQVEEPVALDAAILAAAAEPDAVGADVGDLAALDRAVPRAVGHDGRRHLDGRLRAAVALRRQLPVGVVEGQAAERDVLDELALVGVAGEAHQLGQRGRDDLGFAQLLAGHRPVAQHAGLAVQIPLARLVEQFEGVLDVVPLGLLPVADAPPLLQRRGELDDVRLQCRRT